MPRPPRLHVPGAIYHVTMRGNHRRRIFFREADFRLLESLLAEVVVDHGLAVHAYCWMPNHFHLAVQVSQQPLARPMQRLASRFARRVQARIEATGHPFERRGPPVLLDPEGRLVGPGADLFERRYHAVIVDSERYLLGLVRYIHLNPVRARIVDRPEDYPWSSHTAYLAEAGPAWLVTAAVKGRLGCDEASAQHAYRTLMETEATSAELEYLRRRPARESDGAAAGGIQGAHASMDLAMLGELIHEECRRAGIAPQTLLSPARGRRQSLVRARIAWRAVRIGAVSTLAELTPHLGRSSSALSECLRVARARYPDQFRHV